VADETATAGYQDGMSLGGHIGNILFRLPQQGSSFGPLSKDNAGYQRRLHRQGAIMQHARAAA
jgi:hypothetical protein